MVGRTKLAGTQVIDANHILGLIGSKVNDVNGIQTVDDETLRIIHEQIQELSDMGEDAKANMLKEFVDTELVQGNLECGINFDEAFNNWKLNKLTIEVDNLARTWGLCREWLLKSVNTFTTSKPSIVPYIEELTKNVDYEKAIDKSASDRLEHIMTITSLLPERIMTLKLKYE